MKTLSVDEYYQSYAFYLSAKKLYNESEVFMKLLIKIVGDCELVDSVLDPSITGTKDEFNQYLLKMGVQIDWKGDLGNGKQESGK